MKRVICSSFMIFAAIFALEAMVSAQAVQTVPLYRLYGPGHFYTTSKAEHDSAAETKRYKSEGIAGYVYASSQPGTVELRRFVKETANGTRHYYATTRTEFSVALNDGYKSEGACCWILKEAANGAVPFFHLYLRPKSPKGFNPSGAYGDDHLYTTNEKEKFDAINKFEFVIQPTVGYIWTSPYPAPRPPPIKRK